ncbi:hypothetical protein N7491_004553 [Penicillium cf. griseofulvum]|uniref:Potassium channel tetramerisation-type BTB domain-containing protein n=1 Tax=Penicillium cf. griseofulvum TaxID=2972120 RepID=A0A9W9M4A3_9EURO|nr:hypothetical protein N7472_007243 [Penicillium cf. griseofulvum]KAJ5422825.1 hypothetical protein N7445_010933 [Penicillium cf. griseofulvum]KAJ5433958.1 hypothetical protein N7491_004553 [Penicillium cf. griseofulvum]
MDLRTSSRGRCNLPTEKVFSIQIGSEVFRLSGASIASDAPSYFSHFFEDQLRQSQDVANVRTLYIDRDPATFREIARHLQGYHVRPQDGAQFVKLFADAQFYTLPRLMSQLFESECFIQIGDRHFQIPRDIFSGPGDSPNFFTLGFAAFFASPAEVFPGLDRQGLLRPPAIVPPSVPNRSADVFDELLHLLRGYPLHIRNEDHRASLLRDCRYFHLRGLEQKLIPHHITTNPFSHRLEITIRLEDVRPSGIQFAFDTFSRSPGVGGNVTYMRPFVDEKAADLVVEIGDESSLIHKGSMRADFLGLSKQRITSLLQTVGKKMDLPDSHPRLGQVPIKIRVDRETDLTVDGEQDPQHLMIPRANAESDDGVPPAKRPRVDTTGDGPWVVRTGQWRLQAQKGPTGAYEVVLVAVKLDVYTSPQVRNRSRKFL